MHEEKVDVCFNYPTINLYFFQQVQCYIKKMEDYGLTVPKYLKDSLSRAETKLSRICNSVPSGTLDPLPVPMERIEKSFELNRSDATLHSKVVVEASKQEVVKHVNAQQDSTHSRPIQQTSSMKIPRKSSIDKNGPFKGDKASQTPIGTTKSTSMKNNPPKLNLTSLLGMKGITKEAMEEAKVSKKSEPLQDVSQATEQYLSGNANNSNKFSNLPQPDEQRSPPPHHLNNSNQLPTWESHNICGWGDVHEIIKKPSTTVKTFPTVAEAINFDMNAFEQR
jgi:hypothetical protein